MLREAFQQHFTKPEIELAIFIENLDRFKLPFDTFLPQVRRLDHPGYPTFECGLPPTIYYFIPGTGWGSDKPIPVEPLNPDFVYAADGTGMNFGCPIRLHKALKILCSLAAEHKEECLRNLAEPMKHLPTVEELLWLEVWRTPNAVTRSEGTPRRTHDWKLQIDSAKLRLECKFRPVDWIRIIDGDNLQFFDGYLLGKAAKQLPDDDTSAINIVCFTGVDRVSPPLEKIVANELASNQHIGALIYRSLANEIHIYSLSEDLAKRVALLIPPQPIYPCYGTIRNIAACSSRQLALKHAPSKKRTHSYFLFQEKVRNSPPVKKHFIPELPYRFKLIKRHSNGEPEFEAVTPYLAKDS